MLRDWFLILIIISHLDMGLSDYQNAKKCVFSLVYILPLNLYAAQVDELREQAIHTTKLGKLNKQYCN